MSEESTAQVAPPTIVGMDIHKLFGHYTYELRPEQPKGQYRLLLLYGDNGSGKSTLSQLLFHALSRESGRGHRTFLARMKFHRFSIHFSNGASLMAVRDGDELDGPFALVANDGHGNERRVVVGTSEDGTVKGTDLSDADLHDVHQTCFPVPQTVYYLSDNRVLQSDEFDDESSEEWLSHQGRIVRRQIRGSLERVLIPPSRTRDLTVAPSVLRAEGWLRRQAIDASNEGEVTTSNIYAEIIRHIAHPQTDVGETSENRLQEVLNRLETLASRTKDFSSFGLAQPVALDSLTAHLGAANPERRELLASVLKPYVDSIQSRLEAFALLQKRLKVFLDIMNSFYRKKYVRITVSRGIQVFDNNDTPLDVSLLSSGEKQLMLLLCNILCATTQPSLFIIDEPELSLNIKWQRELVDSLLALCTDSHVQFLMATHSIELLTRHHGAVMQLNDISAA